MSNPFEEIIERVRDKFYEIRNNPENRKIFIIAVSAVATLVILFVLLLGNQLRFLTKQAAGADASELLKGNEVDIDAARNSAGGLILDIDWDTIIGYDADGNPIYGTFGLDHSVWGYDCNGAPLYKDDQVVTGYAEDGLPIYGNYSSVEKARLRGLKNMLNSDINWNSIVGYDADGNPIFGTFGKDSRILGYDMNGNPIYKGMVNIKGRTNSGMPIYDYSTISNNKANGKSAQSRIKSGKDGVNSANGNTSGTNGVNGSNGNTFGTNGVNGSNGNTSGTNGVNGSNGNTSGTNGANGSNGNTSRTNGKNGKNGNSSSGKNGTNGKNGNSSSGKNGINGKNGSNSSGIQGAKGEKGVKGDKGETGTKGATGAKGETGATGATGAAGQQGIQGERGQQGIQGEKGIKGEKGDVGRTGNNAYVHIKYSDTNPTGKTASQSKMKDSPDQSTKWMGMYSDEHQTASDDPADYTWTQYKDLSITSVEENGVTTLIIK